MKLILQLENKDGIIRHVILENIVIDNTEDDGSSEYLDKSIKILIEKLFDRSWDELQNKEESQ